MKSAILASMLFGSLAVAAPFDRRALAYATEVVTETVVVWTTVYEDDVVPEATTTPAGYFYEQPKAPSSTAAKPTSSAAPAYTPPAKVKSSSVYVAPVVAPTPTPVVVSSAAPIVISSAAPIVVSSAAPVVETPKPVETPQPATSAYVAPVAAAVSSAAPAASVAPSTGGTTTSGDTYSDVDITIYDNAGGYGACGTKLYDTDMIVALAQPAWGASTYDTMTGAATNPWCGQKIKVDYNGNSIEATIMDLCPGCSGHDIDLSLAAWKALTGLDEKTRLKASWSKIS